jgi:hypothetical protein
MNVTWSFAKAPDVIRNEMISVRVKSRELFMFIPLILHQFLLIIFDCSRSFFFRRVMAGSKFILLLRIFPRWWSTFTQQFPRNHLSHTFLRQFSKHVCLLFAWKKFQWIFFLCNRRDSLWGAPSTIYSMTFLLDYLH